MAYDFQVAVDCIDPHTVAKWWAEALEWEVEASDEAFIRRMIDEGHATEADTKTFEGTLVWREGAAIRHPDGFQARGRIYFQAVPEPKSVKNRLHLDIRVGQENVDAQVAKLVARGATVLHEGSQGPTHRWITIADPEGNELCIT